MISKYLRILRGEKPERPVTDKQRTAPGSEGAPAEPPFKEVVPEIGINPLPEGDAGTAVIDTGEASPDNIVTSVLTVDTDGKRSSTEELLKRFLGRQPVLDRAQQIVGYELMLKAKATRSARHIDDAVQRMDDEMLLHALLSMEWEGLLGEKLVFVGISPAGLDSQYVEALPPEGVVLAIQVQPSSAEKVLSHMKELTGKGYRFALDNFTFSPALTPFLRLAKYVRLNVLQFDAQGLAQQVAEIQKHASPQLIVKNVETDEVFDACRNLSLDYFQGYYFTRLQPNKPPQVSSDRERVIQLLNMVQNHAEISELEAVFKLDATLSYKLLRYINSPGCGLIQKIRSIAHALVMLGYDQLYRWLTLLLFSSGTLDPRSQALLTNALVRARLAEVMGKKRLSPKEREGLFIAGIFSLLDVLLNVPMEQALGRLNLPDPVVQALLKREGVYGPFLELAIACEEGDQERIEEYAAVCMLDAEQVNRAHVEAMVWAEEVSR
jgi:EAL and modified HD-GYP domain-containing signal transduction protein